MRSTQHSINFRRNITWLSLPLLTALSATVFSQAVKESRAGSNPPGTEAVLRLEPGIPVERKLAGQEAHLYRIRLASEQYLHIGVRVIDNRIMTKLTLRDPAGNIVATGGLFDPIDRHESNEAETDALMLITQTPGDYLLEVWSTDEKSITETYTIKISELRSATTPDRKLVTGYRSFADATKQSYLAKRETLGRAIELYQAARADLHEAGATKLEASALFLLGDTYSSVGEYEKAITVLDQSLTLARALNDLLRQANVLNYQGEAYFHLSEYQQSIEAYSRALPLWKALGRKNTWGIGWSLGGIGGAYRAFGEKRKALDYYFQSLSIYQAIDYNSRERDRSSGSVACNIGAIYSSLGEKQKAIEYLNLGLQSWKQAKEPWGEARAYYYFGDLYLSLGEAQTALHYYQQALKLWRESGDPDRLAATLNSLGAVDLSFRDFPAALDHLTQALETRRRIGDRRGQAETLAALGRVHASTQEHGQALDDFTQSLALTREVGDRFGEATTLHYLGEIHEALANRQQARDYYQQSLLLRRAVSDREGEAQTLFHLARMESDSGQLDEAREQIEAALKIIEEVRISVASQELRVSYLATVQDYYALYLDLLMRLHRARPSEGRDAQALEVSERARARSLLEMLTEARADIRHDTDPALMASERDLRQRLNDKAEFQRRLLSGRHTETQAVAAAEEIQTLIAEYQTVQTRIRASSPRYAALTQPQPLSVTAIQQQVLDDETLLLEYALGEERSYLWLVTTTSLTSFELPKRAEIEAVAQRVSELLTARNRRVPGETPEQAQARVRQAEAEFPQQAATLSQMLLGPAARLLTKKRLLVVTEGALQFVPFGALPLPGTGRKETNRPVPQSPRLPVAIDRRLRNRPSAVGFFARRVAA